MNERLTNIDGNYFRYFMTDKVLINELNAIVGQSINEIAYSPTKFYHPHLNGDWTKINPDLFLLHSPEWQIKFSNGHTLFLGATQIDADNFISKFVISQTRKLHPDQMLIIPKEYKWVDVFDRPINKFRLWQRVMSSSKFLGHEYNVKYQDGYQIIELSLADKVLSITTMNGDLGNLTFYPTGYLGQRVGLYINKVVCKSHTENDLTMRMAATYQSD